MVVFRLAMLGDLLLGLLYCGLVENAMGYRYGIGRLQIRDIGSSDPLRDTGIFRGLAERKERCAVFRRGEKGLLSMPGQPAVMDTLIAIPTDATLIGHFIVVLGRSGGWGGASPLESPE
jgi:hypothetical protein